MNKCRAVGIFGFLNIVFLRQERTVAQELRNEQDVAYFESLERDRQKEVERQRLIDEAKKEEEMKLKKQNEKIRKLEVRE